jgi:hypothetical protein
MIDAKAARDLWQGRIKIVLDPGGYHLMCREVRIRDQELVVVEVSKAIVLLAFSGIGSTE